MQLNMTTSECNLFVAFITKTRTYVEFGCGGSTIIASKHVKDWIISIDSAQEWIEKVKNYCDKPIDFIYEDIGPIGKWGTPVDPSTKNRWHNYHTNTWNVLHSWDADLYFIDGRFRVACFAQIYLHCKENAIIAFHDFASRLKHYSIVYEIGREIASVEDLSFFVILPGKKRIAEEILEEYKDNYR
jgi:hypothetical protein